jgi:hypothetical protein
MILKAIIGDTTQLVEVQDLQKVNIERGVARINYDFGGNSYFCDRLHILNDKGDTIDTYRPKGTTPR